MRLPITLLLLGLAALAVGDQSDRFPDRAEQLCELIGLSATPPEDWRSVPMQDLPSGLAACQMTRTDEQEHLVGIIRLSSGNVGEHAPGAESRNRQVAIELAVLDAMGIEPGEALWSREHVPLGGEGSSGFSDAQAVGLSAAIRGSGLPQEIHILAFHGPSTQYTMVLVTPPRASEPKAYTRNLSDFSLLIQSLTAASSKP